jgi:hypothetical protein
VVPYMRHTHIRNHAAIHRPAVCEMPPMEGITNSAAIHPSRDRDFSRLP